MKLYTTTVALNHLFLISIRYFSDFPNNHGGYGLWRVMQPNINNLITFFWFAPLKVKPMTQKTPKHRYSHSLINPVNHVLSNIFDNVDFGFISAPDCEWPSNPPRPWCLATSPLLNNTNYYCTANSGIRSLWCEVKNVLRCICIKNVLTIILQYLTSFYALYKEI